MANLTGAALITTIRLRAARQNDTVLITEAFVLIALNEAQLDIARRVPRIVALDKKDTTTYRISSAKTVAIGGAVRSSSVVTATTSTAHLCLVGQEILLADVDSGSETNAFSGTHIIASVPSATTFTFAQTGADESNLAAGTSTALSISIATLNPAHIGGLWILNGSETREQGLKYRELSDFRARYMPVAEQSASEPTEYTRQANMIRFNRPVSSDYNGLYLHIDYTDWATDLANGAVASELPDSNKGLILFSLAEIYDEIALAQPRFESKAIKTRILFENWLAEYMDYQEMLIEELD